MTKETQYFAERTNRFLNIRKFLEQQKVRLDDQQIEYDKEIEKEIKFSINRNLAIVRKIETSMKWNVSCRLQDLTIIHAYEAYFEEVAEIFERVEPFYEEQRKKLLEQGTNLDYISKNKDKPTPKSKPQRLMTKEEKKELLRCSIPGCSNSADKNGICAHCFLSGVKQEEKIKNGS